MSQYVKPNINKLQSTIKHIVVLMLENRSFDNLLGWLYADKTPPYGQQYEGLQKSMWNPLSNIDTDGIPFIEKVPVAKNGYPSTVYSKAHVAVPNPVDFTLPNPDPGEGYRDTNYQLFQNYKVAEAYTPAPVNTGFVDNYQAAMLYGTYSFGDKPNDPRTIMKCYTPEQTPVLSELARSFAVCDQYYCSIPSQTLPNARVRHFQRHQLRLAQCRPFALGRPIVARHVVGELHEKKRKLRHLAARESALRPGPAPAHDHRRKKFAILARGVRV